MNANDASIITSQYRLINDDAVDKNQTWKLKVMVKLCLSTSAF